jgi:hypothetical protein
MHNPLSPFKCFNQFQHGKETEIEWTYRTNGPLHQHRKFIIILIIIIIIIITLSGVKLSPLGTAATTGLLYQPQMIDDGDCGQIGGMKFGRENRNTRRKLRQCHFVYHKSNMT